MHSFRLRSYGALLIAALLMTSTVTAAEMPLVADPAPQAVEHARATFEGREIPLTDSIKYHCHDKFFPEVRCFPTEEASLADQERSLNETGAPTASLDFTDGVESTESAAVSATLYTIFYQDWFYTGSSWAVYGNISDLRTIGWDNHITSFKLYSGARPRWFTGYGYTGTWACWTSNQSLLGSGWNDTISSINAARYSC